MAVMQRMFSKTPDAMKVLRVLELYSGIGGMHCALKESGTAFNVVTAIDVNSHANKIYQHNFPGTTLIETGIEALTVKQLDKMKIDMILMSPPCQPFTRVGKKLDSNDPRTKSFLHLLDMLPRLDHCPSYILVENVKGFESSQTRDSLISTLESCNFTFQECLLTPLQFGIPNSRLRYYLIAKKKHLEFCFETKTQILEDVPSFAERWMTYKHNKKTSHHMKHRTSSTECGTDSAHADIDCSEDLGKGQRSDNDDNSSMPGNISQTEMDESESKTIVNGKSDREFQELLNYGHNMRQEEGEEGHRSFEGCLHLGEFLEPWSSEIFEEYKLPDKDLKRFIIMDIVHPYLTKSICFTKRYGHFMEGAGSIVQMSKDTRVMKRASEFKDVAVELKNRDDWGEEELSIIRDLKLRYFTPREIANLLCFPPEYSFPSDVARIQKYRTLGNSLNVHVVSVLINIMLEGDNS